VGKAKFKPSTKRMKKECGMCVRRERRRMQTSLLTVGKKECRKSQENNNWVI
jgi:hypothetical protein